jgi:hypothetical protein
MRKAVLLIACLTVLTTEINAQDSTSSPRKRRTHFEILAGPNFILFGSPSIKPSLKYHIGVAAIRQLKNSSLQVALQYLPFAATVHFYEDYFKFSNHVIAASLMSKLPVTKDAGITIDLGLSYGYFISQWDNYVWPPDVFGKIGLVADAHSILSLQAGTSVKASRRCTVSLLYAFGTPLMPGYYYAYFNAYHMLQASLGYRI